jgi:hypothetical protein
MRCSQLGSGVSARSRSTDIAALTRGCRDVRSADWSGTPNSRGTRRRQKAPHLDIRLEGTLSARLFTGIPASSRGVHRRFRGRAGEAQAQGFPAEPRAPQEPHRRRWSVVMCQQETCAIQRNCSLLDDLVGAQKEGLRNPQAECFSRLQVDYEIEPSWSLNG